MSSFARLSAALGTVTVLAIAGLGSASAFSESPDGAPPYPGYDLQVHQLDAPSAPTVTPPPTYDLTSSAQGAPATPSPAPQPTPLGNFHAAFATLLPLLGLGDHTDPSAGLLPGIQTPPNVAALGRHLVRVYATPEVIGYDTRFTLSAGCPKGGLVTTDPGVRSVFPYIPRVTNASVWSTLASGDVGQSSLSVQFTNKSSYNEIAAFQFVCSVPN
jgi:hypothetical protein